VVCPTNGQTLESGFGAAVTTVGGLGANANLPTLFQHDQDAKSTYTESPVLRRSKQLNHRQQCRQYHLNSVQRGAPGCTHPRGCSAYDVLVWRDYHFSCCAAIHRGSGNQGDALRRAAASSCLVKARSSFYAQRTRLLRKNIMGLCFLQLKIYAITHTTDQTSVSSVVFTSI
jgi:hypothetical protein